MTRYPGGPGASPGFLMWHLTLRWQRVMAETLTPLGLTHVQFVLLACTHWLNGHGETPTQTAIAEQAGTDVKMTSQVLRRLEAAGLLTRAPHPTDARARALSVTLAGQRLADRAMELVEAADEEFFGRYPAQLRSAVLLTGEVTGEAASR